MGGIRCTMSFFDSLGLKAIDFSENAHGRPESSPHGDEAPAPKTKLIVHDHGALGALASSSFGARAFARDDFKSFKFFIFNGTTYEKTKMVLFEAPGKIAVAGVAITTECTRVHLDNHQCSACTKEHLGDHTCVCQLPHLGDHVCPTVPPFLTHEYITSKLAKFEKRYTPASAAVYVTPERMLMARFMADFECVGIAPSHFESKTFYGPPL